MVVDVSRRVRTGRRSGEGLGGRRDSGGGGEPSLCVPRPVLPYTQGMYVTSTHLVGGDIA